MQKITIHLFVVIVVAWIGSISVSVSARNTDPPRGLCSYLYCSCELRNGVPKCIERNGEVSCNSGPTPLPEKIVCASNGHNYVNPWNLARTACQTNRSLTIKHWGKCKASSTTRQPKPTHELGPDDDYTDDERSCDD